MAGFTNYTPNQDIGAYPAWHSVMFDVATATDADEDFDIMTLPIGTIIHDWKLVCTLAQTGATSVTAKLMLPTLAVYPSAVTTDNLGTIGVTNVGEMVVGTSTTSWFPLLAADTWRIRVNTVDESATVSQGRMGLLISRPDRP